VFVVRLASLYASVSWAGCVHDSQITAGANLVSLIESQHESSMHSLLLLAALARFPMIDLLKASNNGLPTESGIMLQKSLTHEARSLLIEHYWVAAIDIQSKI